MSDTVTPEVARIEFQPVPEFEPAEVPLLLNAICERRLSNAKSYGAYVIRGFDEDEFSQLGENVRNTYPKGYNYVPAKFPKKGDQALHTDRGMPNEVTAHHTQLGSADFAILVGSSLSYLLRAFPVAELLRLQQDILTRGIRRTEEVGEPTLALRTALGRGDLLLFDHTQPHIFKTTSKARLARAQYCELPPAF